MNDLHSLSDQELISIAITRGAKDERAFNELFHRYHLFVSRVLYRYFPLAEDVEDLTQEVFFKAYRGLGQFGGRSSLKTWLFSIANNTAKNELRNRSRRPALAENSVDEFEEFLPDESQDSLKALFRREDFLMSFAQMEAHEQQVLLLKDVEGLSYEEIARRLQISLSASKMRVQRARQTLRKIYQEQDHER